ncbi:cytochrome C [Vibrio cholerae]|nr:cytochrome C [Vibrio cholerae]
MKFLKAFWLRLSSPSKAAVGEVNPESWTSNE